MYAINEKEKAKKIIVSNYINEYNLGIIYIKIVL